MGTGLTCSYREDDPLRYPDCAVGDGLDIVGRVDGMGKPDQALPAAESARLIRGQARTQRPIRSNVSHSPMGCPRRSEAGLIGTCLAIRAAADRRPTVPTSRLPNGGRRWPISSWCW